MGGEGEVGLGFGRSAGPEGEFEVVDGAGVDDLSAAGGALAGANHSGPAMEG